MLLVGVGLALGHFAPTAVEANLDRLPGVELDTDNDGLIDEVESAGWQVVNGNEYRTDPYDRDTDDDGLEDGEEAGPAVSGSPGKPVFTGRSSPISADTDNDGLSDAVETGDLAGLASRNAATYLVSSPLLPDTDGDGVEDGDEFFLDMNPLASDTDRDGFGDGAELDYGSDPTLSNPDGDTYPDAEEAARGLNPLSYDLNSQERAAAGAGGLTYGDCTQCALNSGMKPEQVDSAEYLAGHLASGLVVYGDVRDVALDLWMRDFSAAGVAALAFLPLVGDSGKAVSLLTSFGKRGDRAAAAVRKVTQELPLSPSVKRRILRSLPSEVGKLPPELRLGPKNYVVYKGYDRHGNLVYVGITDNFARRAAQHQKAGRSFEIRSVPGATALTRGEARSIEQACIYQGGLATAGGSLQNTRNSINPDHPYASAAVAYGTEFLQRNGATCR